MYEIGGFEAMMTIQSSSSSSSSSSTTTTSSSSLDENSIILEETTSHHPSNNSSNNNNNVMVGFHVRDGPVPRGARVDNDVDGDGRNRRSRFMLHKQQQQQQQQQHHHHHHLQTSPTVTATTTAAAAREKYGSLMDPHVPIMPGQTHLIQGGTPCDLSPNDSLHRRPYILADYGEESVYTLILLQNGKSEWNASNRYTGWCDVNLTRRGEHEARAAGSLLVDHAFTSVLRRASYTTNMALNMAGQHWVPIQAYTL